MEGSTGDDIVAATNGPLTPLQWNTGDILPEMVVDRDVVTTALYTLLETHGLLTHRALQLLTEAELQRLCGCGDQLHTHLMGYYRSISLEPRQNQPIAVRAVKLYGSSLDVPVTIALSLAFNKKVCNMGGYRIIRDAVWAAGVFTIGNLVAILASQPRIDNLSSEQRLMLCDWLGKNIFLR